MKKIRHLIVFSFLVIAIAACNSCKQKNKSEIKIGAILPLTGDAAQWGIPAKNGASLAVTEINDSGGINGNKIALIVEDDQCDGDKGVSAFNKLISTSKPNVIVGAVCSGVTLAI